MDEGWASDNVNNSTRWEYDAPLIFITFGVFDVIFFLFYFASKM